VEAVREEEVKLRRVGFLKEVGFKPGVKERWSSLVEIQMPSGVKDIRTTFC